MKTNWQTVKLGDVGQIIGGGTPSTKVLDNYENGTISWITPKDLSNFNERYISKGERSITEKGLNSSSARLLPKDTVLFSSRAPIGYVAIAEKDLCTNQGFKSIIPNKLLYDSLFLYYLLKFKKTDIESIASGSTFMEVSGSTLKKFEVEIPSLPEQERIAGVLSALDDKIENNNAINKKLEEMAQAIFKSYFIDFTPFNGSMPNDWQVGKLSDIAEVNPKESIKKGNLASFIEMKSLPTHGFSILDRTKKSFTSGSKFRNGDILLARITPCLENGKTGFVDFLAKDEVAFGSTEFIVLRGIQPFSSFFIACLARFDDFRHYAIKSMVGSSGRQRVQCDFLAEYKLALPPKNSSIVYDFEKLGKNIFSKILNNNEEIIRLTQLRDSLLPKLMSGELKI